MKIRIYIFIIFPTIVIATLFFYYNYFFIYPSINELTLNKKKEMIKELSNVEVSITGDYYEKYIKGI